MYKAPEHGTLYCILGKLCQIFSENFVSTFLWVMTTHEKLDAQNVCRQVFVCFNFCE